MFRTALLSIVFSLAVGQNVALLCSTWCGEHTTASGCHHKHSSTTPSMAGDESCGSMVVAVTAVVREDLRRGAPSPDANQAIPAQRYQVAQLTIDARPGQEPWSASSLEKRPLSTALRI